MRLPTSLPTNHAPRLLSRFLEIIGPEPWLKRYRVLLEQVRLNPLLRDLVTRRHSIELTIGRFVDTRSGGFDVNAPSDYAAFSFIAPVAMIYESLTPVGKARIAGILRDGLNRELRSFQNEIETVTHLANVGFDIAFPDLEGEAGFDFLAIRDRAELEVECKSVSGDLGRQVHERRMAELSNRILRDLKGEPNGVTGGILLRVTIPGRLPSGHTELKAISASVREVMTRRGRRSSQSACEVTRVEFDIATSPFSALHPPEATGEEVRGFVKEQTGLDNVSTCVRFSPGRHALVIVVESRKQNHVVGELVRHLKEAADAQFSRARPAVLVVQLLELNADAILELGRHDSSDPSKAPALQLATNQLLHSPGRSHIHSVVYRSHGTLVALDTSNAILAIRDIQEQGPTYTFFNSAHPQASDLRYRAFRLG